MNKHIMIQNIGKIKIFRDDLYPFLGGGNKGRKMDTIAKDILAKKANALVTTGGIQSNHCRAVSVFASQYKMKCSLIIHGNQEQFYHESGNAKVMRMTGAEIIFVDDPGEIAQAMDKAMKTYEEAGLRPYYIYGGGHTMEGGWAYIDAVAALKEYCELEGWFPDYIFLASGTGSTQAGILAGLDRYNLHSKVIGISVGRKKQPAEKKVEEFYRTLCEYYKIPFSNRDSVVLDEYLCGGYGKYNDAIKATSNNALKTYGFILDTCYTGKAFYGMQDYIHKMQINENLLFWHTGGIFNFLAE